MWLLFMVDKLKRLVHNNIFVVFVISVYFFLLQNTAVWNNVFNIYESNPDLPIVFKILAPIALFLIFFAIFTILLSYKYVLKPAFVFLFLTNSLAYYSSVNYSVVFDFYMIVNIFETNHGEALAYLSWSLVGYFVLYGLLPSAILIWYKVEYPKSWLHSLLIRSGFVTTTLVIVIAIVLPFFQQFSFVGRNNKSINALFLPMSYVFNTLRYAKERVFPEKIEYISLGDDAKVVKTSDKPILLVLVLGETARAKNYSDIAYKRDTNQYTKKQGIITFNNVFSCGTATAISVPCMFSKLTRSQYDSRVAENSDNLLDILAKAGDNVVWLENNSSCKGVCKNVPTYVPKSDKYCTGSVCLDGVLLDEIKPHAQNLTKDTVIVVHLLGSHGPNYYKRYPQEFRNFTPDCSRNDVENCSIEEVINAYDNTILYTDYIISKLIEQEIIANADHYNSMLLYVSDHGESLGELGMYLHGSPYLLAPDEQKHIPMQFYISDQVAQNLNIDKNCLAKTVKFENLTHDNLFHTVLGLMKVQTKAYEQDLDAFAKCMLK